MMCSPEPRLITDTKRARNRSFLLNRTKRAPVTFNLMSALLFSAFGITQ